MKWQREVHLQRTAAPRACRAGAQEGSDREGDPHQAVPCRGGSLREAWQGSGPGSRQSEPAGPGRRAGGNITVPDKGSMVRSLRSGAARFWRWSLDLRATVPNKQCLLKKKQALSFLGALPTGTNTFWRVAVNTVSPQKPRFPTKQWQSLPPSSPHF